MVPAGRGPDWSDGAETDSTTVKGPSCNLPVTTEKLEELSMGRFRFETPERAEGHVKAGVSEQSLIHAVEVPV